MAATETEKPGWRRWQAAIMLALVASAAALVIALVAETTSDRITENRQQRLLRQLESMLPVASFDNNPALAAITINAPGQLQTKAPVRAFLATRDGELSAAVFAFTTHDGYSGDIALLVAIDANGSLLAVRIGQHQETPGIGDQVEQQNSDWLEQFNRVSSNVAAYDQQHEQSWSAQFDHITGATITSSAVIDAVQRISSYYQQQRSELSAVIHAHAQQRLPEQ